MPLFLHPILESVAFCPHLPRQQKAPRFFWEDECANFWPACPDLRRGMSPHSGVSQVPLALPVGLHPLRHSTSKKLQIRRWTRACQRTCLPARNPISRSPGEGRRFGKARSSEQVRIQTPDFPSLLTNVRSLWSNV
jgi:hypothetical protein